jgi:hypothetical protein
LWRHTAIGSTAKKSDRDRSRSHGACGSRWFPAEPALSDPGDRGIPGSTVGQLAIEQPLKLDLTSHGLDREQVEEALARLRGIDTFRAVLVGTAGAVLGTMGMPVESSRDVLEIILRRLTTLLPRRIVHGPSPVWYGHPELGLPHDPLDVLVELNRWARNDKNKHDGRNVDQLLMAAFLADLRAEFDRKRRSDERSLNCVVLLDNADTELGRRFLNGLVRARRERDDADHGSHQPGRVAGRRPSADLSLETPDNIPGEQRSRPWWRRYQLPGLTEDDLQSEMQGLINGGPFLSFIGVSIPADARRGSFDITVTPSLCAPPTDVVLYAGREVDLGGFLDSLVGRQCRDTPLTVITADDIGNLLSKRQQQLRAAKLTVVYAGRTDGEGPRYHDRSWVPHHDHARPTID